MAAGLIADHFGFAWAIASIGIVTFLSRAGGGVGDGGRPSSDGSRHATFEDNRNQPTWCKTRKTLFILNHAPYGTEHCYNALRLASTPLKKDDGGSVTMFLMADAVLAAKAGQITPEGYYNIERMLKRVFAGKGEVLLCGTCMDARGIRAEDSHSRSPAQHDG